MQSTAPESAAIQDCPVPLAASGADTSPLGSTVSDGLFGALNETAKVMIVDDEPVNIKVVQKHLKLAGYQHFVTSTDPRPVLEMSRRKCPT